MKQIILVLVAIGVILAGVFAVMAGTLFQSVVALVFALACFLAAFSKFEINRDEKTHLGIVFLALMYFSLRAYFSPCEDLGVSDLLLILPAVGLYLLSVFIFNEKYSRKILLGVFVLIMGLNLLCFIPVMNEFRDSLLPFAIGEPNTGMYNHRNFCSNMLMMGALLSFSIAVFGVNKMRIPWAFIGGVCVWAMVEASARGAYIGLFIGLLVIAVCSVCSWKSSKMHKAIIIGGFIIGGIVVVQLGFKLLENRGLTVASSNLEDRLYYYGFAVDQISDSPWVGSGSMSYSYKSYENWGAYGEHHWDPRWVHNEFLQIVTDYGILGLILTSLFLGYLFIRAISTLIDGEDSNNRLYIVTGLVLLISFSANSFFSFPGHSLPNLLFWVLGLSYLSIKGHRSEEKEIIVCRFQVWGVRVMLIGVGVLSVSVSLVESRAMTIFVKHEIFVDNANWTPAEHTEDNWLIALEKVNAVSPTYQRLEREAGIKLEVAAAEENVAIRNGLLHEVLRLSEESLERHPYYWVSLANKAEALTGLKRYEEAVSSLELLCEKVKYRRKYFRPYEKLAKCLIKWAGELGENDRSNAIKILEQAEAAMGQAYFPRGSNPEELEDIVMLNRWMLSLDSELTAIMGEVDLYYKSPKVRLLMKRKRYDYVHRHAVFLKNYADRLYLQRKPSEAMKWYLLVESFYRYLDKEGVISSLQFGEIDYGQVQEAVQFLKKAEITPAP